jgi:hypothetical protein
MNHGPDELKMRPHPDIIERSSPKTSFTQSSPKKAKPPDLGGFAFTNY